MMELLNEFISGSAAWGVLLTLAAFALLGIRKTVFEK